MAEETESKSETKVAKKAKKTAVPEAPPEAKQALPTAAEIRTAKKAELIGWTERYGLSQEGKVDDLRKRLRAYVEKEASKAAAKEEEKPATGGEAQGKTQAREEGEKREGEAGEEGRGRRGRGRGSRAPSEAEARTSPEETPRIPSREERPAAEVPPSGVVPLQQVRRCLAEAARRPIEAAAPLRLSMESPFDRVPGTTGRPRVTPERLSGGPRPQRRAARRTRRRDAGGPDRPRGRHPQTGADRESVR